MDRAALDSLMVGDAIVRDHIVVIGGFIDAISTAAGAALDGVIGSNFLNQFLVALDYPQSRLRLAVTEPL